MLLLIGWVHDSKTGSQKARTPSYVFPPSFLDTLATGGRMMRKIDEWPWNRSWPWIFFITPIVLFTGWLWMPIGRCAGYTEDYEGDTSCYVGPQLATPQPGP